MPSSADPAPTRAAFITAAWNAGDVSTITAAFAENIELTAVASKAYESRQTLNLRGKAAVSAATAANFERNQRYRLVSSIEKERFLSMVLEDGDGERQIVTMDFDADGRIFRLVSYRA